MTTNNNDGFFHNVGVTLTNLAKAGAKGSNALCDVADMASALAKAGKAMGDMLEQQISAAATAAKPSQSVQQAAVLPHVQGNPNPAQAGGAGGSNP